MEFRGVFPILLTPFSRDGSLDLESLRRMVRYYMRASVDGLTILGEVSESEALTQEERESIIRTVMEETSGSVPVVCGITMPSDRQVLMEAERAARLGVDAFLLGPHRGQVPMSTILGRYRSVSKKYALPTVVLDNPALGFARIGVDTLRAIVSEAENVVCVKVEEQPSPPKVRAIRAALGTSISILGALHGRNLLWELAEGADGVMTSAPIPEHLVSIYRLFREGKVEEATDLFAKTLPLANFYPERTVAVKKAILKELGVISEPLTRDPFPPLDEGSMVHLRRLLQWTLENTKAGMLLR
ncbi:dihydrodipicolinate synthase family protein [Thermogymnomonas acidicola]|uniref:Dihydrodipicolinate synthase family protein n=1 Tax=Thermogymnomonas acidicola TaxID=399579 RepID=A0AA37BRU1_9ARCH|nr:dihydrodipicolinate synthase family protein [Thermogymnomonas acidicola]GGM76046.1 dihydrodipicolinate synthase family protein [Thermogymnomonas acidicola]